MKILFSDFDGTLVHGLEPISKKNSEMMRELRKQGHLMVICTGRNIREYQRDAHLFDFPFDYLVLNNGGQIVDKDYNTVYEKTISKEVGIEILDYTTKQNELWSFYCDGKESISYYKGVTGDHALYDQPIDKDFFEEYHNVDHFQIICFNQDEADITYTKPCFDYVKEHFSDDVEIYFNLHYVDVVPKGCSKGTGIRDLLSMIDGVDEVYAIGDSYNDLAMIETADYGYTFTYAHDDIKSKTDRHVDYVYEVIEDMLK